MLALTLSYAIPCVCVNAFDCKQLQMIVSFLL
jgi:hypothetical protein